MKNRILSVVLAVLCILSMIPFAAFAADAYVQYLDFHTYTGTKTLENPYRAGGNYVIYGYNFANDEFDGEDVVAISRNSEVADVYAEAADGATSTSWQTNFYNYNEFKVGGRNVSLYDSKYIVIDYYYDTSAREENPDETFTEIVGNKMAFVTNSVYLNGTKDTAHNIAATESADAIVANTWDTIVIDYATPAAAKGLDLSYANESASQMGQFKIYPFGTAGGINMHAADVFYIKSVRFMSFDPTSANYSSPISVEVFTDEEGSDWVYDSFAEGVDYYLADSFTLPEFPEEYVPAGGAFIYYKESHTGETFEPGESAVLNWGTSETSYISSYTFYPVFSEPETVTFIVDPENDEKNFTESWYLGVAETLPAAPEAPEGLVFAGWSDGTNTYPAGSKYNFTDANVSFTAVFVEPGTYYVSAEGSIEGIDDVVYTTLDEADNAAAARGGVGTIIVDGVLPLGSGFAMDSSELVVKGYDNEAKLVFNATTEAAHVGISTVFSGSGNLIFDDIIIKRGNTSNDEAWIELRGINLTFESGCGFEQGDRYNSGLTATTGAKLDLYIAQLSETTVGYDITINSEDIQVAMLSPNGGWGGGNKTFTGDVNMTLDNGYVSSAFLGNRNGNGGGSPNTINGDVLFTMNGGTLKNFNVSFYPVKLNGDATAVFNGGAITGNLEFGDDYDKDNQSAISGTLTYVINASGYATAPVVKAGGGHAAATSILVYNNTELVEGTAVENDVVADYLVLVNGGTATPVAGANGKFTIEADNSEYDQVLANGVVIEAGADGYYTLEEGTTMISFGKEGFVSYNFSYATDGGSEFIGSYYAGTEFVLPALAPNGNKVHDSYVIGGVTYETGDKFTMPAEDVVAEVVWFENTTNTWYVSKNGNNNNPGHKESKPLASIAKAFEIIGTNDGTIILVDMVSGFDSVPLADGQTVRITGEGYEGAGFANGTLRLPIPKGHLILDHLIDYNNVDDKTNIPFIVQGNAELTIGTGYKIAQYKNGIMNVINDGTQVEMPGSANPVVNADGDMQFITFADCGTHTITGDVTINIGPNAKFNGAQGGTAVSFGGDGGTITSTVSGKIFVNVNGTQDTEKIFRNGFKDTVSTVLNGFQILLKDTTITYGGDHSKTGSYTNNGPEYIVTANTIDGSDVVTTTFGKVKVTLGADQKAIITDANGTREITETQEIELAEGETLIECATTAEVNVVVGTADPVVKTAGTLFTLPEGTAPEGELFLGWTVEDDETQKLYVVGSQYKLPVTDGATVIFVPYTVSLDSHVYIDQVNGLDTNKGFSADDAVQTIARAVEVASLFPETATLHVVGALDGNTVSFPAYNGVLTIVGTDTDGVISYGEGLNFASDIVLEDIGLKAKVNHKHITLKGNDLTLGAGAYKVEGSNLLVVHAGVQNANMNGDQAITVTEDAYLDTLQMGPYYITSGEKTWTGDIQVNVTAGGHVGTITYGDGYTGAAGTFVHDGATNIFIDDTSSVNNIHSTNYNTGDTSEGFVVYNYGTTAPAVIIGNDTNTFVFNFTDDITGTYADGVLTVNNEAYDVQSGDNAVENVIDVIVPGVNTIRPGKSVMNDGLTIKGAQIRIETEDEAQGLRFIAEYTDELAAQYEGCEYGFVVIPTSVVGNASIDADDVYGDYAVATVVAERIYKDMGDYVQYTACLIDLAPDQYKTSYTAVPYILTADGYVYGEQYSTSVYAMAKAIVAEDNTEATQPEKAAATQIIADADAAQ